MLVFIMLLALAMFPIALVYFLRKEKLGVLGKCIVVFIRSILVFIALSFYIGGMLYIYFMEERGFLFSLGWLSIHVAINSYHCSFYKLKKIKEMQHITGKRLLYDLSPKVLIAVFRYFFCFSFGVLGAMAFTPELTDTAYYIYNYIIIFVILFIIGLCGYIAIFASIYKQSKEKHILKSCECTGKTRDFDSETETTTCRIYFDRVKACPKVPVYDHAEIGNEYYAALSRKGEVLEIYDVKKWIPAFDELSLSSSFKSVIGKICSETLLHSLITFLFPIIVNLLSPVVEQIF